MVMIREYIEIDCKYVKYLIIKGVDKYYITYCHFGQPLQHFGSVPFLKNGYRLIKAHLLGRHQAEYSYGELMKATSDIRKRDFEGVNVINQT